MHDRIIPFLILLVFLFGCTFDDRALAKDKVFYFSITAPSGTDYLVEYLTENLTNKRVAITHQSGQEWPFYEVLAPSMDLPLDSLMPPHSFVHLLKPRGEDKVIAGEYFVDIKVMALTDTLPNYELDIYKMTTEGLALSASSGIHFIEDASKQDPIFLYDTFLKSIIRYSFK